MRYPSNTKDLQLANVSIFKLVKSEWKKGKAVEDTDETININDNSITTS